MQRRDLMRGGVSLLLASQLAGALDGSAQAADVSGTPFDSGTVRRMAHDLAQKPFQAPDTKLPDWLKSITYDKYRMIRFDPNQALWRGQNLPFQVQFFHRGFLYQNRVDMFEVADGKAKPIQYSPSLFSFGENPTPTGDLGFAGFRLHAPINRPDYYDEICAFLGASYFRAVAKGQGYGLSARGLALKTADPKGEEFPIFRSFWIERPRPGVNSIVVYALLDSQSAAASFRFTIRPGVETVFDTEMALYPRVDITEAGIAPLTSMFYFAPNDRDGVDDYRPAVHDSDGLLMWTGHAEQIWRPLANPRDLQISAFADVNPRGFGLLQRRRDFAAYEDLEAHYEKRPSAWVEPIGDWGEGTVMLVEIPTNQEIHDNIVAFWRPKQKLNGKGEYIFTYRLHWCMDVPWKTDLAKLLVTRSGAGWQPKTRIFVIDALGGRLRDLKPDAPPTLDVHADKGKILNPVAQPNPETGGWRMSFELAPENANVVELRAQLTDADGPLSETWVYRWTP